MSRNRAFTLIELMVAMAVTSLLVVLLVSLTSSVSNAWQRGEAQTEVHANARGVLNLLGRELQGALVDLDLGFHIAYVPAEPNNFRLRFLSRTKPEGDTVPPIMKVCYQLAWADTQLIPELVPVYDKDHPIPVLARTESSKMDDVFNIPVDDQDVTVWTDSWGQIPSGGVRTGVEVNFSRTEVAAENVLGWRVTPVYWDTQSNQIARDKPDAQAIYYGKYLTSDKAPKALEVEIATVASKPIGRLVGFNEWGDLRRSSWVMDLRQLAGAPTPEDAPSGPFTDLLRQNVKYFSSTIYLQSKTP